MMTPEVAETTAKQLASNVLLADFPINFFWMDKDGTCLGCNDALANTVGLANHKEIVGRPIIDFVSETVWQNSQFCLMQKKRLMIEEAYTAEDGKIFYFFSIKEPLFNKAGEIEGILGISIDITKRKETEFALAEAKMIAESANEAKSNFLNNISHEFRTPLTAIVSVAELLQTYTDLPSDLKGYTDILKSQSKVLWDLTERLLDYRRLEQTRIQPKPTSFDIFAMVNALIHPLQNKAREKGITLSIAPTCEANIIFTTDGLMLSQILQQLLDNALKFTHAGQITLSLYHQPSTLQQEDALTIEIKDTGIGIPSHKIPTIFEPFMREGLSDNSTYSGIGMGLASVKAYVKALRGTIHIDSKEGKGTSIIINLPPLVAMSLVASQ